MDIFYSFYRYMENMFLFLLLCYILHLLLTPKYPKIRRFTMLLYSILFGGILYLPVLTRLISYPFPYNYFFLAGIPLSTLYAFCFFKEHLTVELTYVLFYYAFVKTFNNIFGPIFNLEHRMNLRLYQLLDFCIFLVLIISLRFFFQLFQRHPISFDGIINRKNSILALYCPFSFLIMLELTDPQNFIPQTILLPVFAVCLIINLPIVYYLYSTVVQSYEEKIRLSKALMETQAQLTRYRYTLFLQDELKKERHELKNRYFYIQTLLREHKYDQLDQYLNETIGQTFESLRIIETGNTLMDYLLNTKLTEARKHQIKIFTEILVPEKLPINEDILCTVLLNLLDNAIEASLQESDPDLHITMKCVQNYLVCKIANKTGYDVLHANPQLHTTKKDAESHGLGTQIIRSTMKKCDGIYDVRMEQGYFVSQVMFPLA